MKITKTLAACLLLTAIQANAEPFRFEVNGAISEIDGDWPDISIGGVVTIEVVGDLAPSNGTFEIIDNGEEDPFPRYTFSGAPYGAVISGAFGDLTTTTMSFEPIDNFDTDADGNPFGLTGVVDALIVFMETPNTAPFFGGEVQIILFQENTWFDGANSLPTEIDPAAMLAMIGQAEGDSGAEAVIVYDSFTYKFGDPASCTPSGSISIGDSANGELSRVTDCYFEGTGRMRDFTPLTLDAQSVFSLTMSSSDFSPLGTLTESEAPFQLIGSALDTDGGSEATREYVLPAATYRLINQSLAMNTSFPPAGSYTNSLAAVTEPQLGCQNTTLIQAGVSFEASLDSNDCQDDVEGRATFDAFVDGYTVVLPANETVYLSLQADFDADLVWEKTDDSDDVIEEDIASGQTFTLEISADAVLGHTLVVAAADNASLGAYTLTLSDTAPSTGGSGSGSNPDTDPEPGTTPTDDIPAALKVTTIGGADRDASFALGAYTNSGEATFATDFITGDFVTIIGEVSPDSADVGINGELYAAMLSVIDGQTMFTFLNTDGNFEPWDLTIPGLGAAVVVTPLEVKHEINVFEGTLQAGVHKITFAYQPDDGPLVYMKPITIRVTD